MHKLLQPLAAIFVINDVSARQSEMANTSHRHTPLKSKILISFHDVISLLAPDYIFLIDRATQEVPMKNIPLKSNFFISFHDVISLLAPDFIFLIDRATQEVPMKNI